MKPVSKVEIIFWFTAFMEGALVITLEILSMRLISSYFGNSIITNTSVLAIAMSGLAVGYFLGSIRLKGGNYLKMLSVIFYIAGLLILLVPVYAPFLMELFFFNRLAAVKSCMFFLFPVTLCLGISGPLAIQTVAVELSFAGKYAGKFYSISSFGGILASLFLSFYLIEKINIQWTLLYSGYCLIVFASILSLYIKRYSLLFFPILAIILSWLVIPSINYYKPINPENSRLVTFKDGMLGHLLVEDRIIKNQKKRFLHIDNLPQSCISPYTLVSTHSYVHKISSLASNYPDSSDALVLGVGGGSLVIELLRLKMKVDGIELNPHIKEIDNRYFGLNRYKFNFIIDDARHFINTCSQKYDLIILDVISGEYVPSYLFTNESFAKMHQLLNPGGSLIIYFTGSLKGENSKVLVSLYSSLKYKGYERKLYYEKETPDDVKIIISTSIKNFKEMSGNRVNTCCRKYLYRFVSYPVEDINTGELFSDDRPVMDIYFFKQEPRYKARTYFWDIK